MISLQLGIRAQVAAAAREASAVSVQKVESPVVIVTGVTGASRGIGKAVALALVKSGCKVCF